MVRPRPTLTLLALLAFAACGPTTSVPPSSQPSPAGTPTATGGGSPDATPAPSPGATTTVRAYFILGSHTNDSGLVPVLREVPQTEAVGAAAITALLAGPNASELAADPAMYSWIPAGVKLLDLTVAGGVATVHLSSAFGTGGGDAMTGGSAQVVYTLTQFPAVTGVQIYIDGIVTSGPPVPAVRAHFTKFLPAIWVDEPAWGGALAHPARVQGLANVFEAQFQVELLDAAGHTLVDQSVTASCGTGCWGMFDVTLPYTVATAQSGTLRVYDLSAKDGRREHIVDYPVTLTP